MFERRWFARRRCLDVGCNEGLLTLALATRFGPRSMLGVDIDSGLIGKACRWVSEGCRQARAGYWEGLSATVWVLLSRRGLLVVHRGLDAE